ncbi:MAG TPA: four helix bundle protein [Lentisphaeria bacterium]|nr:MAG: four helix bundle protein [Lentisphaerae bacterium GWF2_38_69]HBM15548.1 four helix bundle protein [Lentisphaeria bacterium]
MSDLIQKHGGYRNLMSFQIAQLVYDLTARFAEKYIDRFSRTKDQMVQAARSGVQNIAEGSQASATSKKTELKLTNVARASLEELKLDYEDFLRQRSLELWGKDHKFSKELIKRRFTSLDKVVEWTHELHDRQLGHYGHLEQNIKSNQSKSSGKITFQEIAANTALVYIHVACSLLSKQIERLANDFENEGGFTERLYKIRQSKR